MMKADTLRRFLLSERERFLAMIVSLDREGLNLDQAASSQELSSVDQHMAGTGSETFERTKHFSIRQTLATDLGDVEHALAKIDTGVYGVCEVCGKKIARDRLEALPATRYCVGDQVKVERDARV
jgi:RNA polymerase-binding transcription factor DksA